MCPIVPLPLIHHGNAIIIDLLCEVNNAFILTVSPTHHPTGATFVFWCVCMREEECVIGMYFQSHIAGDRWIESRDPQHRVVESKFTRDSPHYLWFYLLLGDICRRPIVHTNQMYWQMFFTMWVVGVYFYSVIWAWSELYCNYNISNSHNAHIFKMSSENAFASNTNNVQVLIDCWISCFVLHTHTHTHRTHTI